ncbi:hypothetical protein MJ588_22230 [Klebsiella pneumoniae]|nr:hypothetical protein MJ588_22230 [Klebsiella pneumoniae]
MWPATPFRRDDLTWNISQPAKEGLVAKGIGCQENQLRGYVVSVDKMKETFALLKQLVS